MEKVKKNFDIATTVLLVLIVMYLAIGILPYEFGVYSYEIYAKVLTYLVLPIYIIFVGYKLIYKEKLKPIEFIVLLIIICLYFSVKYAVDKKSALYGYPGRQEGFYEIMLYYGIFLVSRFLPKKNQNIIIWTIIGIGVLEVLLGHVQHLHLESFLGHDMTKHFSYQFLAASGTFGNPNFFSTFTLLISTYLFVYLMKNDFKSRKIKVLYIVLLLVFCYGLIISNTSSGIIIFLIIVGIFLGINIFKNKKYKLLFIILGIIIASLMIIFTQKSLFINRVRNHLVSNFNEVVDLFKYGINEDSFNGRVGIWNRALSDSRSHKLTGVGIDNFAYLNNGKMICSGNVCYDKAHNEFLQIYLCEGIVTLLLYITFICYIIKESIKKVKVNDYKYFAILIAVISYFVQSIFNIRIIEIAPMLFMLLGFLLNIDYKKSKKRKNA